jgi:hypothetical protein
MRAATLGNMTYWLDLFTPYTWNKFREHGASISGFRPRQRRAAFERVKRGDIMLCYLVKLSRWCGILEIISEAFEDTTPIFAEINDPFPIRFQVKPRIMLDFEHAVPIEEPELWRKLSFTRGVVAGSRGWAQHARLRQSLLPIPDEDGELITRILSRQQEEAKAFKLDTADLRHVAERTVVRTEQGEVAVEVPEREDEVPAVPDVEVEVRASLKTQAKVAQLGATLGFSIWIPPNDRTKVQELSPKLRHDKFVTTLPLNYDLATLKTIENIDVIWLDRRSISHRNAVP